MNRIYLVRHGENTANLTLEFSHRKVDYSLTPKGVLQARQAGEFLRSKRVDEVYTSPLKRAVETAEIIGQAVGRPVEVVEEFREVNVGDLEGQKPTAALWEFHNGIVHGWQDGKITVRFPNGENLVELLARAKAGFERILRGKTGRNLVIVGHGGIFTFAIPALCGPETVQRIRGIPMANCAVSEMEAEWIDGRLAMRLVTFSEAGHLSGEAANLVRGIPAPEDFENE